MNVLTGVAMLAVDEGSKPGWLGSLVVSISLGVAGGVLVWIGRRQAAGTLARNDLAGYRTKTTMASDEAWKAAHDTSANQTTWAGIVFLVGGALLLTNPSGGLWATTVATTTVVGVAFVIWGGIVAQRAAKHTIEATSTT